MKILVQSISFLLLISSCMITELIAQTVTVNGVSLDSAEVNWKYVRDGYAPYVAQTKEKERQINYRKTDTVRINYRGSDELIVSQKEESVKLFQKEKKLNKIVENQVLVSYQEDDRTVHYGVNELDFEIYQVGREYTESEKAEIAKLRQELLIITRQSHALAHKKTQIQKRKKESKNHFIGNSVQWHDTCLDKKGFFFYFPPTHIAQKLFQLGASIRAGFGMIGKNKKLAQLKAEQNSIKNKILAVSN